MDYSREHVRTEAVVNVPRAGLLLDGCVEEGFRPVLVFGFPDVSRRVRCVARGHGEEITDGHRFYIFVRCSRRFLGEERDDLVGELQFPLRDGEAYGHGSECFADGVEDVRLVGVALAEPVFGDDLAMLQHHDAVQILLGISHGLQIFVHGFLHFRRSLGAGETFGQLVEVYQADIVFLDSLANLRTGENVRNTLTIDRHVLVTNMPHRLHFRIVVGWMVEEEITLSVLQLVQHADEAGHFLLRSLLFALVADESEVV